MWVAVDTSVPSRQYVGKPGSPNSQKSTFVAFVVASCQLVNSSKLVSHPAMLLIIGSLDRKCFLRFCHAHTSTLTCPGTCFSLPKMAPLHFKRGPVVNFQRCNSPDLIQISSCCLYKYIYIYYKYYAIIYIIYIYIKLHYIYIVCISPIASQ